jgi:hypothetical protein
MKKTIKNALTIVMSISVLSLNMVGIRADAVVNCGSSSDGYRCHDCTNLAVSKYHTFGDKVMNYGVGQYGANNRYYWIDTNLPSTYTSPIQTSVSEWVYTSTNPGVTTSISISQTYNQASAYFEIIRDDTLGTNILGYTEFYLYNNIVPLDNNGALTGNYGWTQIHLNTNTLGNNTTQIQSTTAHELGHGMGLSHQNCRAASIMCQTGHGRTATRADATDLATINHLYG